MNNLKFIISGTQYLKINPEVICKDDCEVCAHCDIDYIDEEKNISIRFGYDTISSFCYFIARSEKMQKLLHGEIVLDDNLTNDPGFEWNQYYEGKIKDTDVIEKYHFVSNSHKHIRPFYNSWLYNDEEDNIILEITPFYSWHNVTKKTNPEKISYKEWIKHYKPILKIIISKENIKQWAKQSEELAKLYKLNLNYTK
jgi:hypothetical protein